jgi:hypothetical protein
VGVVAEVAELSLQVAGLDAVEGVGAGGVDDRIDVAGVEVGVAVSGPLGRVGGDEGEVGGQVGEVLAGVVDACDVGSLGVEGPGHGPDSRGAVAEGDDLAEMLAAAAQVLGFHELGGGVLAAEGGGRPRRRPGRSSRSASTDTSNGISRATHPRPGMAEQADIWKVLIRGC